MASTFIKLPVVSGGGGGGGDVDSFNGRTGAVVSQAGDYSAGIVSNTPSGNISATTVQAAINEIDGDITSINSSISTINSDLANKQPLDPDLTAIAALSGNGIIAKTGAGTANTRTITAGANISVTNGDGVSGNPNVAFSGVLPIANGGTQTSTAPGVGQLLIGNGTTYTLNQISAGAGLSVTNAAGSITINLATPINQNIDGGQANSVYGGTTPINGGNA